MTLPHEAREGLAISTAQVFGYCRHLKSMLDEAESAGGRAVCKTFQGLQDPQSLALNAPFLTHTAMVSFEMHPETIYRKEGSNWPHSVLILNVIFFPTVQELNYL